MRYVKLSFAPENGFDHISSGHIAFIRANEVVLTFINEHYSSHLNKLHIRAWIHGDSETLSSVGIKQTDYDRAAIE